MSSDKSSVLRSSESSDHGFLTVDPVSTRTAGAGVARALAQLKPGASSSDRNSDELQLTEPRSDSGESLLFRRGVVDKIATVGDKVLFESKNLESDVNAAVQTPGTTLRDSSSLPLSFPIRHAKPEFLSPMSGSVKTTDSARTMNSGKTSLKESTRTSLFYSGLDPLNDFCCGVIGKNSMSFCTKRKSTCQVYARRGSHYTDRAEIQPDLVFIKKSVNTAWKDQSVEEEFLNQFVKSKGPLPLEARLDEWKAVFSAARTCDSDDVDAEVIDRAFNYHNSPVKREDLKTPGKVPRPNFRTLFEKSVQSNEAFQAKVGIYLSETAIEEWKEANIPLTLIDQINSFSSYLRDLGSEVEDIVLANEHFAPSKEVASDLLSITASINGMKQSIGNLAQLSHPDICSSISDLNDQINKLITKSSSVSLVESQFGSKLESLSLEWDNFKESWLPAIAEHEVLLSQIDARVDTLETSQPNGLSSMMSPRLFSELNRKHKLTLERLTKLETEANDIDVKALMDTVQALTLQVAELKSQANDTAAVDLRQEQIHRTPDPFHWIDHEGLSSDSVSFGTFHFENGEVSILSFIKKFMTRPRPGLFNDLNTLFEFMPGEIYVEKGTTLGNLNHGNKIGFTNAADATVATSFDNILPGLFARIRATPSGTVAHGANDFAMTSHPELPGLPNYRDWDAGDTNTGRKFFILRNLKSTKTLIDRWIRSDLRGDAQILAFELLAASVFMAQELVQFISGVYHDLCTSGRFDDGQAWGLACKFVKRIFSEIGDERVVARDNIHCDNLWASTAKIIYGILRAHKVMKEFMRLNLRDHPSISSEMVKFVCYSQPASDTSRVLEQIEEMSSIAKKTASTLSKHESRIKKVENWKEEATKTLKKVN